MASTPAEQPAVLTLVEAAEFLRVSERTLWAKVKADEVPHFRIGKQIRFHRRELEAINRTDYHASR